MTGEILKLNDFLRRCNIQNDYAGGIACIRLDSRTLNLCELSNDYIDAYSVTIPLQGSFRVSVNYTEHLIKPGNCLLLAPHLILSHISHSNNFEALFLLVEHGVFEQLLIRDGHQARMDVLNETRPVIPLNPSQQKEMSDLLA